ncbi:unnamed protein product [Allacma fusca]|uniref:Sugar phosphate transporter domain-containing protein n=1 Tax=Allacma fusca TaxID=39272 RepID=A0A8J2KN35_9HEXA|nr:unnamed protein product [Allacma fusca]
MSGSSRFIQIGLAWLMAVYSRRAVESTLCTMETEKIPAKAENGLGQKDKPKIKKIGFAVGYAVASVLIMSVTKVVLTTYTFPSPTVIVIGQMITTLIILFVCKKLRFVQYPDLSKDTFSKLHPLPFLYLANAITGLGGTKALSLPMFTAIRRIAILLTMILEYYLLGVKASTGIQISVYVMIIGAFIAAMNDFTVSLNGYVLVILNNFFTAIKGVIIKKKLDTTEYGPFGLMYYNALFMVLPAVGIAFLTEESYKILNFTHYDCTYFWVNMFFSCTLGFVLVWTMVECTNYNSSLTTCIVGAIKNIVISYAGMFIGGDYVFWLISSVKNNFITVSILSGI